MTEINHKVSKEASSIFWRIANNTFHRMYVSKGDRGRKIPQFQALREKIYKEEIPTVKMEVAFKSKDDGEVTILEDVSSIPVSMFPPSGYRRLYEIASVDVSIPSEPELVRKYTFLKKIKKIESFKKKRNTFLPCKHIIFLYYLFLLTQYIIG